MGRSYKEQVKEGRQLVAAEEDVKWRLGDLALEVAPITEAGSHNDALARFAEDIGSDAATLGTYRRVASEWPPRIRTRGASWTVHKILAPYEDAVKIINRLVKEKRATVTQAHLEIGQAVPSRNTSPQPTTTTAKAAQAKELLADPLVRREVVKDIRVRADINRTTREHDAQVEAGVKRRQREGAPGLTASGEFLDALSHVTKARTDCLRAVEFIRGIAPLSANQRKTLTRDLGYLGEVIAILNQYAETGQAGTLADEIEAFLAAEVSE